MPSPHDMTPEQQKAYANKLLARADKILAAVDDSYIIKQRGHKPRAMPLFRPEEISLGPLLGTGGFGIVNEIKGFCLDHSFHGYEGGEAAAAQQQDQAADSQANGGAHGQGDGDHDRAEEKKEQGTSNGSAPTAESDNPQEDNNGPAADDKGKREVVILKSPSSPSTNGRKREKSESDYRHDVHYDVTQARQYMSERVQRNGTARYALKRLHGVLSEIERARGMVDLAVEAKYLSTVWHPNIIKMRGMAAGPLVDRDFFIIMDRLYETLDKRMNTWYLKEKKANRRLFGLSKNKHLLKEILIERMTVAYDLAAAFFYLHENRLVYRDIKPENIGFDVRGDVKVFDFGLCKSLAPNLKAREGYGYRLTGRAGSLPYMAPEVARMETYDTKCDVFSFAILLWEVLALKQAFKGMSPSEFMEDVVINHMRLQVPKTWPPLTRLMIPEAWDRDPKNRPDMKRVAILIRGDLNDMTNDDRVIHRTKHMVDRSQHSLHEDDDAL